MVCNIERAGYLEYFLHNGAAAQMRQQSVIPDEHTAEEWEGTFVDFLWPFHAKVVGYHSARCKHDVRDSVYNCLKRLAH